MRSLSADGLFNKDHRGPQSGKVRQAPDALGPDERRKHHRMIGQPLRTIVRQSRSTGLHSPSPHRTGMNPHNAQTIRGDLLPADETGQLVLPL